MENTFQVGDFVGAGDVLEFVYSIHYNKEDFGEGDIAQRIYDYEIYKVQEIPVQELEEPSYYIDEELIEKYKEMGTENIPPVVLGYYGDGDYMTIDGGHRTEMANELGLEKIKAFVGIAGSE